MGLTSRINLLPSVRLLQETQSSGKTMLKAKTVLIRRTMSTQKWRLPTASPSLIASTKKRTRTSIPERSTKRSMHMMTSPFMKDTTVIRIDTTLLCISKSIVTPKLLEFSVKVTTMLELARVTIEVKIPLWQVVKDLLASLLLRMWSLLLLLTCMTRLTRFRQQLRSIFTSIETVLLSQKAPTSTDSRSKKVATTLCLWVVQIESRLQKI